MSENRSMKTVLLFVGLLVVVVGASFIANRLWGGSSEEPLGRSELLITEGMTLQQFGESNGLANAVLKEIFGLKAKADLQKKVDAYGSTEQVTALVVKKMALAQEHASKNWLKIVLKFGLWFAFLTAVFMVFRKRRMTGQARKGLLFAALVLFGIVLGSDPSPMGTVKDAIHLYATAHAVFPPRMIALLLFLSIVFVANKYICAWGCQLGTLQDLIFRINQTAKGKAILARQVKIPFGVTNGLRVLFLVVFTLVAFAWGVDIVEPLDPFKVFKPASLGLAGALFAGLLLLASLFVYRPWCHLFCPFGLVGWLVEKKSRVRISVDYDSCIACGKCAQACPSTVMAAILRRDTKTIPDCFACYGCREVCPTDSIRFSSRQRTMPPAGHFDKNKKD